MKSVVLLSSGLDSTVNLYCALKESEVVQVLTFDYGQRAAAKEVDRSTKICAQLNLKHKVIKLDFLKEITNTSLVNTDQSVPVNMDIDDGKECTETADKVWVPNRNGLFLNIAAAFADSLNANWVVPGFNLEEAQTFPDNSKDYLNALTGGFKFSTQNSVVARCFTTDLNKIDIAKLGKELNVPFEQMWPCYFAEEEICGECESCLRFKRALNENIF